LALALALVLALALALVSLQQAPVLGQGVLLQQERVQGPEQALLLVVQALELLAGLLL
jgi:hypothetical protein